MCSRARQTIRYNPRRSGAVSLLPLLALALLATSVSGCAQAPFHNFELSDGRDSLPEDDSGPWTYRDPTEKELLLARSDFSVELVRFTDARRPRSMELESTDERIYQYDPDTLLGGVTTNVPAMLGKYLTYRPRTPKHYKAEVELKKLTTKIKAGTFWSGKWGRYYADVEMKVIVRRPDSTVAMMKTFRYDEEQRREDYNGRGPTRERDRARMVDLTASLMRKAAEDIGWNLRQRDARLWDAPEPQSIPTRLNMPPVDQAAGTEDADAIRMPEPVVVPAIPAEPADLAPKGWMMDLPPAPMDAPMPEDESEGMPPAPETELVI